ncbi:hypothetical protein HPB50_020308 [Hyalomma asiaticum]|uniref:Uncharacterized protein n=1 Tax=Hyalomma asiaticum TaxID=266040 RepID=A0ACB7RMA3_HYAAI|nr:hypothetical protein HPB50_020308 [Hyalomma asiaticum]
MEVRKVRSVYIRLGRFADNLFQYFGPLLQSTPAFVTLSGALISDVPSLVDFVPSSATTLILHVGSNDLARSALATFQRYRKLLDFIHGELPEIRLAASTAFCEVSADVPGTCPVWITCSNDCRLDEYWQLMKYT